MEPELSEEYAASAATVRWGRVGSGPLERIPGAGHLAQLDSPALVTALLAGHVGS